MSLLINGEILLYGDVGDPFGWGDGFTPRQVAEALADHGPGDVTVRVNSGGGIAFDGLAIYSILKAHDGVVTVINEGVAASAASLIFMAGATRRMRDGAMLMIHDAAAITFGNADRHLASAATLDKISEQYAGIYARASGLSASDARALMRAETWFTAEEAVSKGFATVAEVADAALAAAAFDYRLYAHAPASLPVRRKADADPSPKPAPPPQPKDVPMSKNWVDAFFASAEKAKLPLATLNKIVKDHDTLEAAQAALIEAQAAAPAAPAVTTTESDPVPASKDWAGDFFATAEKSGLPLADLNQIVAKSADLAAAQASLIDAMAVTRNADKPKFNAASPLASGDKPNGYQAGRAKVLALKGKADKA